MSFGNKNNTDPEINIEQKHTFNHDVILRYENGGLNSKYLEGTLVNRFVNVGKIPLSHGDVVAVTGVKNSETGSTILEAEPYRENLKCTFVGVVVCNGNRVAPWCGEIKTEEIGYLCTGGLCPFVRVDSLNFVVEHGDLLIAGPNLAAVPLQNGSRKMSGPFLGVAFNDVEQEDNYLTAFLQPLRG